MTGCERMSDRMPDVACGAARWSDDETAHLDSCGECAAEWRLVRVAAGMPTGLALDADWIAGTVATRLRDPSGSAVLAFVRRPAVRVVAALAAAALLVAVLGPGLVPSRTAGDVAAPTVLTELGGLDSTELTEILDDWAPAPAPPPVAAFVSGLSDLSADELEAILHGMET